MGGGGAGVGVGATVVFFCFAILVFSGTGCWASRFVTTLTLCESRRWVSYKSASSKAS